jgi:hypothetical protein
VKEEENETKAIEEGKIVRVFYKKYGFWDKKIGEVRNRKKMVDKLNFQAIIIVKILKESQ